MAFQLYVQPRGGELIGRGIESAANSISNAMMINKERKEQRKQEQQLVEGFKRLVDADPQLAQSLGINSEEDWDNFSPNQIKGAYEGLKMQAAQGAATTQQLQLTELQRRMNQQGQEDQFLQGVGLYGRNPDGPWSPEFAQRASGILANPDAAFAANMAAETGMAPSAEFMERYGPGSVPFEPSVVNAGGYDMLMTSPNSAVPVPRHYNQEQAPEGGPLISADGRFYQQGGEWKPIPSQGSSGPRLDAVELERYTRKKREYLQQLDELEKKRGDASSWRFMPGASKQSIERQIQQIQNELAGINAVLSGPSAPAQTGTMNFATVEEANAALAAGQLQPGDIITIDGKKARVD